MNNISIHKSGWNYNGDYNQIAKNSWWFKHFCGLEIQLMIANISLCRNTYGSYNR